MPQITGSQSVKINLFKETIEFPNKMNQSVGRSVGRSVRPSVRPSVRQSVSQSVSQAASQPVSQSVSFEPVQFPKFMIYFYFHCAHPHLYFTWFRLYNWRLNWSRLNWSRSLSDLVISERMVNTLLIIVSLRLENFKK